MKATKGESSRAWRKWEENTRGGDHTSCSSDDSSVERTHRKRKLSGKRMQHRKRGRTQSIRSTSSRSSSSGFLIDGDETDSLSSGDWDEISSCRYWVSGCENPSRIKTFNLHLPARMRNGKCGLHALKI